MSTWVPIQLPKPLLLVQVIKYILEILYAVSLLLHCSTYHPEHPERVSSIWSALEGAGYMEWFTRVEVCSSVANSNSNHNNVITV